MKKETGLKSERYFKKAEISKKACLALIAVTFATAISMAATSIIANEKIDNLTESVTQTQDYNEYVERKTAEYTEEFNNKVIGESELSVKLEGLKNIGNYIKDEGDSYQLSEYEKYTTLKNVTYALAGICGTVGLSGIASSAAYDVYEAKGKDSKVSENSSEEMVLA